MQFLTKICSLDSLKQKRILSTGVLETHSAMLRDVDMPDDIIHYEQNHNYTQCDNKTRIHD